jgi:hypothetical protein
MPIRFVVAVASLLACALVQAAPASAPAYAPVKQRVCAECALPKVGFPLPRHAVVVGSWGFFEQGTDFQVFDLDTGKLVRAFVPSPSVPGRRKPRRRCKSTMLPKAALPQLVEVANRIWAAPQPIGSRGAFDTRWNLWLIDGRDVRLEGDVGLPAGLAAEWMRRVNKLLGVEDPALVEQVGVK